jgi:CRP-like cAMP-binding protein
VRSQLLALAGRRELASGEKLLRQGQANDDLFIIESGSLVVTREVDGGQADAGIATLGPSEFVGDMSVLRGVPANANVIASGPASVRVISGARLKEHPDLFAHLRAALGLAGLDRLDRATKDIQARHERELKALAIQVSATRFIVANFVAVSIYMLSLPIAQHYVSILPVDSIVSLAFIITFFLIALHFIRGEGERIRQYGITLNGWRDQLRQGAVWALPVLVLLLGAKTVLVMTSGRELHVFDLMRFVTGERISVPLVAGLCAAYLTFSFAQELVRCAIQKALEIYFSAGGRSRPLYAALVTSLIFAATHSHLGISFAAVALVASLYWSAVYRASGSYLAVSFNHGLIGAFAIFIVGAPR